MFILCDLKNGSCNAPIYHTSLLLSGINTKKIAQMRPRKEFDGKICVSLSDPSLGASCFKNSVSSSSSHSVVLLD